MCINVREKCVMWSKQTYGDSLYLDTLLENDQDLIEAAHSLVRELGIYDKKMTGYTLRNLCRNDDVEELTTMEGTTFSEIFHRVYKKTNFSPSLYMLEIVRELIDKEIPEEQHLGWLGRSMRAFGSFLREPDFASQLLTKLKAKNYKATYESDPVKDAKEHTDILLTYFGRQYRIWSYQKTPNALYHLKERLLGNRGEVPTGIHLLAPIDTKNVYDNVKGWYFAADSEIDRFCDELDRIRKAKTMMSYSDDKNGVIERLERGDDAWLGDICSFSHYKALTLDDDLDSLDGIDWIDLI